jgi:uncharacterized protein YjbJ (UPF0337 family)
MTTSTGEKIKGKTNEVIGKGKQGVGEATNNPGLKGEGKAQEIKGKGQQAKGEVKEQIKKTVDKF